MGDDGDGESGDHPQQWQGQMLNNGCCLGEMEAFKGGCRH